MFASLDGNALEERNVRTVFTRLLEKAGLLHIRIHDLRHTYASLLLQQGESVVYVKEQLGHSSLQITVDTYGHLIPGANRAAVDRLDDVAAHPNATQARPDAFRDESDTLENGNPLGESGEPRWNRTRGRGRRPEPSCLTTAPRS
ncbi:MAG: site-specific integrase, partial [Acidobacteriota bacterium]